MTRSEKIAANKADKAVSAAYRKVGNCVEVPMLALPGIHKAGVEAFKAGGDVEEALRVAIETVRVKS